MVSRPQAVRLLHVSGRTFDRLEAEGVVAPMTKRQGTRGATYDAAAIVASYLTHIQRKLTGSNAKPRDRRDRALAELTELKIARERGVLLPRDGVVEDGQQYIGAVLARLCAIVPRLQQDGTIDHGVAAKVTALIEETIEEMAGWTSKSALLEALEDL